MKVKPHKEKPGRTEAGAGAVAEDLPQRRTDMMLINVAYFDEARALGRGKTGLYIERIDEPGQARAVSREIDRLFANSPDET
jgi:hypothetical protein